MQTDAGGATAGLDHLPARESARSAAVTEAAEPRHELNPATDSASTRPGIASTRSSPEVFVLGEFREGSRNRWRGNWGQRGGVGTHDSPDACLGTHR